MLYDLPAWFVRLVKVVIAVGLTMVLGSFAFVVWYLTNFGLGLPR